MTRVAQQAARRALLTKAAVVAVVAVVAVGGDGSMAALMPRPMGTLSMIGLTLHGAMGRLGEAAGVEGFEFEHMVVLPRLPLGHRERPPTSNPPGPEPSGGPWLQRRGPDNFGIS